MECVFCGTQYQVEITVCLECGEYKGMQQIDFTDPSEERPMPKFSILTGENYSVQAETSEEAIDKLSAYINGRECPCGKSKCICVEFNEIDTWVVGEEN